MSKYEKNDVNVIKEKNRNHYVILIYLKGRSCALYFA